MNPAIRSKLDLFGAWCGVLYVLGLVFGWALIGKFVLPLHRPSAGAEEIAAIFQASYIRIRIGMIIVMFTAMIFIPFSAVITKFVARVEGENGVLTYSTLLGASGVMVLTFYPAIWWLVAAFRLDRSADFIYLMNDMAWLQDIGGVTLFFALPASMAFVAFCDTSEHPVFPRWSAFFNLWVILLVLPDQLLFFFHSGPFAWDGLFGFWLPAAAFGSWFLVTFHLLRREILRARAPVAWVERATNHPVTA